MSEEQSNEESGLRPEDTMDTTTISLLSIAGGLGVIALFFLMKYIQARTELRSFKEQLYEIRTTDREQPIKVASLGASTVELAQEINLLVAELRGAVNRSAEEERRVRTIMAGVSHDFRTPLTAADGYLQMVEEILKRYPVKTATDDGATGHTSGNPDAAVPAEVLQDLTEVRDYLAIVAERVRYLKSLSDEFFEVTYLDARKEVPLSEVRLDMVLSEVILGQYQWIQEGEIETRFRIPEEKMVVLADRHYLERILENLFSNARKYTKSFLEVEVSYGDASEGGNESAEGFRRTDSPVAFIIRNDIREYTELDPEHIFEPFYRAKGRTGQGTGLGLYVCKELAEAMHFKIGGNVADGIFELKLSMPKKGIDRESVWSDSL